MSKAAEYLERAAEDEAAARQMSRHDYRDYFLGAAREWRVKAAAAARVEAEAAARLGAAGSLRPQPAAPPDDSDPPWRLAALGAL